MGGVPQQGPQGRGSHKKEGRGNRNKSGGAEQGAVWGGSQLSQCLHVVPACARVERASPHIPAGRTLLPRLARTISQAALRPALHASSQNPPGLTVSTQIQFRGTAAPLPCTSQREALGISIYKVLAWEGKGGTLGYRLTTDRLTPRKAKVKGAEGIPKPWAYLKLVQPDPLLCSLLPN